MFCASPGFIRVFEHIHRETDIYPRKLSAGFIRGLRYIPRINPALSAFLRGPKLNGLSVKRPMLNGLSVKTGQCSTG